ncbi:MAG: exodeoxyribonuclease VII large subunit [Lewinellaceae bacterium]|nr:exodeoxyribonuclease VII large subunit [Lewinellaceae bacterium]
MQTYSLSDLQQYIRQVLALNFAEQVWITAELGQVSRSRGHVYLDLVQKGPADDSAVIAQAQAVLWQRDYQRLRATLGPTLDDLLHDGRAVRLQVRVDYHERYGLKLLIADIDPALHFWPPGAAAPPNHRGPARFGFVGKKQRAAAAFGAPTHRRYQFGGRCGFSGLPRTTGE